MGGVGAQIILCCKLPGLSREGPTGKDTRDPPPATLRQLLAPTGLSSPAAPAPMPAMLGRLLPCSWVWWLADTMHKLLLRLPSLSSFTLLRRLPAMLDFIQLPKCDEEVPSSADRWRMRRLCKTYVCCAWPFVGGSRPTLPASK